MRKTVFLGLVMLGAMGLSFSKGYTQLNWVNLSREILDVRSVAVGGGNCSSIYIGTSRGVFKSQDSGNNWRVVLQNKRVNLLSFAPDQKGAYALTDNGLWYSVNQGGEWKVIFKGKSKAERDCRAIAVSKDYILLGTAGGLFISRDQGRSWHKAGGKLANLKILAVAYSQKYPEVIYVASVEGVYKTSDAGSVWNRIYTAHATEGGDEAENGDDDTDEAERFSAVRYISIDPQDNSSVYLATEYGVYQSKDAGSTWDAVDDYGLLSRDVRLLTVSPAGCLHAATESAVFAFDGRRWNEVSFELAAKEIYFINIDEMNNLYIASDLGLFKAGMNEIKHARSSSNNTPELYGRSEPDIASVQEAAIKYAEVDRDKIERWRKQARLRAFFPKITFDLDRDRDKTVSTNTWGIYSSYANGAITAPGRHYAGPNDETHYYNDNWGVSLTWELGDFVWSEAQTAIDVRSRLMVQLRDDILDEVTKLYFERIRVKMEIASLRLEERKKRAEKELKIAELAASIDALTGGYFSKQCSK